MMKPITKEFKRIRVYNTDFDKLVLSRDESGIILTYVYDTNMTTVVVYESLNQKKIVDASGCSIWIDDDVEEFDEIFRG